MFLLIIEVIANLSLFHLAFMLNRGSKDTVLPKSDKEREEKVYLCTLIATLNILQ